MASSAEQQHAQAAVPATVAQLLAAVGIPVPDGADVAVSGVTSSTRRCAPGSVFVAVPGEHTHGARWVVAARAAGAVAVVTDEVGAAIVAELAPDTPVAVVDHPRAVLGELSAVALGRPADRLLSFGVTGTNGKTTTTYLLAHLLELLGRRSGLIGTVETRIAGRSVPSTLTTPEADQLHATFGTMVAEGCDAVVMEVSSHALASHRVDGIRFAVAGFTNLSRDHLDFHHDMAGYLAAKAELFTPARAERGVVMVDDEYGVLLAGSAAIPVVTLGLDDGTWRLAATPQDGGSLVDVTGPDGARLRTTLNLPGLFNVKNLALALVMLVESGVPVPRLQEAMDAAGGVHVTVPGRMERVVAPHGPVVVVDFAHNPDALELAAAAMAGSTTGRLIVVTGATGERDTGKRPTMGAVAARWADTVVVTDDDPHGEDPAPIRAAVFAGAVEQAEWQVSQGRVVTVVEVAPRAEAIRRAIAGASEGDAVLVAGRGHEVVQEVAGVDVPLDDRVEAAAALAAWTAPLADTPPVDSPEGRRVGETL